MEHFATECIECASYCIPYSEEIDEYVTELLRKLCCSHILDYKTRKCIALNNGFVTTYS